MNLRSCVRPGLLVLLFGCARYQPKALDLAFGMPDTPDGIAVGTSHMPLRELQTHRFDLNLLLGLSRRRRFP